MIDCTWVTPQIGVGGALLDEDIGHLAGRNINAVVDVRSEYGDNGALLKKSGVPFLHIAIDDCHNPTFEQLETVFHFVGPLLDDGKRVFIHCQNGYGRSPLIVAAILTKRGMNVADAVWLLEDKHPRTNFSITQEKFVYVELDKFLQSQREKEA